MFYIQAHQCSVVITCCHLVLSFFDLALSRNEYLLKGSELGHLMIENHIYSISMVTMDG